MSSQSCCQVKRKEPLWSRHLPSMKVRRIWRIKLLLISSVQWHTSQNVVTTLVRFFIRFLRMYLTLWLRFLQDSYQDLTRPYHVLTRFYRDPTKILPTSRLDLTKMLLRHIIMQGCALAAPNHLRQPPSMFGRQEIHTLSRLARQPYFWDLT